MRIKIALIAVLVIGVFMLGTGEVPQFIEHTIATDLKGGYQVVAADLNRDGKPDLIALASDMPDLVWFENPTWERHVIAGGFTKMINLVVIDSGTHPIIVLASNFSSEAKKSLGIVSVLEPGDDVRAPWTVKEIDRLPTSHRLRLADIDGSGNKVVINSALTAAGIAKPDEDAHTPLVYYRVGEWKRRIISDENKGVVHGMCVFDWDGDGRDEILTASFVGIHLYSLLPNGGWTRTELTKGDPAPWPKSGASDIAVGSLGGRRFLCSIEPWHGNQVAVYCEDNGSWMRYVIDSSFVEGHAISTADLNKDGKDEIIAGYRGEGGSLYIYNAEDDQGLYWKHHDLDKGGIRAASCTVVDLNGDGKPDVVCIGSATSNLKWYENR
jgi:hypothetical protein